MSVTPNRSIPLVEESTLDPAAGTNDALQVIDALLQCAVISMAETEPPATGQDGDLYIVAGMGGTATGDWAGHENDLARLVEIDGGIAWQFYTAGTQVLIVYDRATQVIYRYSEDSPAGWGAAEYAPFTPVFDVSTSLLVATPENHARYTRFNDASPNPEYHFPVDDWILGTEFHGRNAGTDVMMITTDTGFTLNLPFGGADEIPARGNFTVKIVGDNEADLIIHGGESGGGGGVPEGTSFPGSPLTGEKFYRTDRLIEYYYDGTRWLSTQLYTAASTFNVTEQASTSSHWANPWYNLYQLYFERAMFATRNEAATPASNYFALSLTYNQHGGTGSTSLASGQSTQGETVNEFRNHSYNSINTVLPLDTVSITFTITETGAASTRVTGTFVYRLVG